MSFWRTVPGPVAPGMSVFENPLSVFKTVGRTIA